MITTLGPTYFYFMHDQLYLVTDHPDVTPEIRAKFPHIPQVNQVALDLFCKMEAKAVTAEGKLKLLKRAIELL